MTLNRTFIRFCLVGLLNTAIDTGVFVTLHGAGFSIFAANFISTSLALANSLLLNSRYTFRDNRLDTPRIVGFFSVTLAGIWILQPLVIAGLLNVAPWLDSTFAKLITLALIFLWNYVWYSRVIFDKERA